MADKAQRRVLIPVDESGSTLNAIKWYLDEVARPGDHVILLTVVPFQVQKQTNVWVSSEEDENPPPSESSGDQQQAQQQLLTPSAEQEARKELIKQARGLKEFFGSQFQEVKERFERQFAPQSTAPCDPNNSSYSQEQQQPWQQQQEENRQSLTWEAYVRQGSSAGEVITEAETKMQVNFVIMGTRGLSIIRRMFGGSVSDYVLHNSPSTVIIVPHVQA